ncbi:MAG TPA: TonB-dependent receptor [Longimicrobium sp.]|nr:TonB-dependent receptor [Longimicrobium sp.]
MRRHTIAIVLAVAAGAGQADAQVTTPARGNRPEAGAAQAAGGITGVVVGGDDGAPIRSASAEVRSAADSSLVTGALTGADGAFRIQGLRPGRYYLRVSALGRSPTTRAGITISAAAPRANVGQIRLAAAALQLEGLTATAERREAALAPDRNSYSLRDMPATTGGNTVDALRNVPAVEVDVDGKVSLRGNENVVVQINGRPSPLRGEQLGNYLAQLPANMVDRVEVIPNPSARYDPEGMAGILNIVLRQNTDLGSSGGLTVGGGTTGQVNVSGNAGYQKGPLTLYSNYGFQRDRRSSNGFTYRENRYLTPFTSVSQDNEGEQLPISHTLNSSAEYRLGSRDVLSSNVVLSTRSSERDNVNLYRIRDAGGNLIGRYDRLTDGSEGETNLDAVVAFRRTFQPRRHEFSTEVRFNRGDEDERGLFTEQPLALDGNVTGAPAERERTRTDELSRNFTLQADYTRPLGGGVRLETGYKGTLRQIDSEFAASVFQPAAGDYVDDASRSNAFAYDEQVHALYGVVGGSMGKVDLQGGLRVEQASNTFDLATTRESFDNNYRSLFPSALAAYNLDDSRQVKASYSRRIERPRTWLLNPFTSFDDPLNLFSGNPRLQPEYTDAYELGFQQSGERGTFQVTPFYRHTTNAVRRITTLVDSVSTTQPRNVATSDSYGADLNASVRLGRVTGFGGVSAYRQVTDGSNLGSDVASDAIGWSARVNSSVRVTPRLDAQAFFMYRAPMRTEQGRVSSRSMVNLALRQKLMGDRASLSLRVVDPFNTMGFGSRTDDERFYLETERDFGARGVFATFSMTFGRPPRVQQPRQEQPDGEEPGTAGIRD